MNEKEGKDLIKQLFPGTREVLEPSDFTWMKAMSLEDYLIKAIEEKKEKEVIPLLRVLPPHLKEKYRKIWKERVGK